MKRYVYLLIIGFILLFIYNLPPLREALENPSLPTPDPSGILYVEIVTSEDQQQQQRQQQKEKEQQQKQQQQKEQQQQQQQKEQQDNQQRHTGYSGQPDTIPPQSSQACAAAAAAAGQNNSTLTSTIPNKISELQGLLDSTNNRINSNKTGIKANDAIITGFMQQIQQTSKEEAAAADGINPFGPAWEMAGEEVFDTVSKLFSGGRS